MLPTRWRVVNKLSFWTHIVLLSAQLALQLRRARPDVLVGGDFERFECVVACLAARHLGRPFVLWSDTWHWPLSARRRMRRPLVRWMVKRADVLVAGGSKAAAKLVELGGAGKPLVNVYHTNVTARPLDRRPERFVLYVGRLEERKGVEYLLHAFAGVRRRHPDLRLRILGRGERLAALTAQASRLGVEAAVEFVGWVDHAAVDEQYRRCAVFVLPSIFTADGGYEPFSNVVLEAMACGAPVISTTANGASYDVLEHGVNGLVVPDRDAPALERALLEVLDAPAAAEAIGRRGWETIRDRFNVDRMAERFGEALDHALTVRAGGG